MSKGKIYAITAGEYSDFHIEGYAKTEEEARKICEIHNRTTITRYGDYWGFQEVNLFTLDETGTAIVSKPSNTLWTTYLWYWRRVNTGTPSNIIVPKRPTTSNKHSIDVEIVSWGSYMENEVSSRVECDGCDVVVTVVLPEYNLDKSFKIAKDTLVAWAEQHDFVIKDSYWEW